MYVLETYSLTSETSTRCRITKHFKNAATREALGLVNWNFIFHNKTVHAQVLAFEQVLMNIFTGMILIYLQTMYPTNINVLIIKIPRG